MKLKNNKVKFCFEEEDGFNYLVYKISCVKYYSRVKIWFYESLMGLIVIKNIRGIWNKW